MAITHVTVIGMGFTQSARTTNGGIALWKKVRKLSSPSHLVLSPFTWKQDPYHVAGLIDNARGCEPSDLTINGWFYSWGVGQFFKRLVPALAEKGMHMNHAHLCDGVRRTRIMPTWLPLNPLSLSHRKGMKLPWDVNEVTWCYQRLDKPCGHKLIKTNPATILNDGIEIGDTPHQKMDDCVLFHDIFLANLEKSLAS